VKLLPVLVGILFVVGMPPALILTTIRLMVFDPAYYQRGYERHGVATSTGMSPEQLDQATAQIQSYFRGGPPVSLVVEKEWGRETLFNAREQQHLADVRDLLSGALRVQEASLVYVLGVAAVLLSFGRRGGRRTLARWVSAGAGLTLVALVGVGLLALGDFQSLWARFHVLSFSNDLWLLDPRTDYMIRLYPLPFWFDAVTDVAVRSAAGAVALLVPARGYLRWLADRPTDRGVEAAGRGVG
jgi:integral membrane protein (TIGR01906 family)